MTRGSAVEISVIVPVRDGARFVGAAIDSILAQIGDDDEVLAVDDGSVDDTPRVLAAVGDRRLKVLNGGGRGVSSARNLGLTQAGGSFVAFLDHDDLWPTGRHRALFDALAAHPNRGAAFGRVRIKFEADAPTSDPARGLDGKHICELVGSGLYRAEPVRRSGGFSEDMRLREDADFHARLMEDGLDPILIPADALIYRRHGDNVTHDEIATRSALLDLARRKLVRRKLRQPDRI